jgi:hypothetical protein
MPARDPQSAAFPSLRSMHVETRRVVAHAARTGELPQNRCRYRINRMDSAVAVARTASAGNSGPSTPGGSCIIGHLKATRRRVRGDRDSEVSSFSSQLRRSCSSGDTSTEEEPEEAAA